MNEGLRVLVATVSIPERELIQSVLAERTDVEEVLLAQDGVEADAIVRGERLDLAVVCADLALADGIGLVRSLALSTLSRRARTVLILGQAMSHRVRDALRARPSALIVRPYDREKLRRRIELALAPSAHEGAGV